MNQVLLLSELCNCLYDYLRSNMPIVTQHEHDAYVHEKFVQLSECLYIGEGIQFSFELDHGVFWMGVLADGWDTMVKVGSYNSKNGIITLNEKFCISAAKDLMELALANVEEE